MAHKPINTNVKNFEEVRQALERLQTLVTAIGLNAEDFDAKGDLLAGTADGAYDQVTVGTDTYVLNADSSTTTGLAYRIPYYSVAADITARDAIPSGQRVDMMLVGVQSNNTLYYLQDGITNSDWVELSSGAGPIADSFMLLDDGSSYILLDDGVSKLKLTV